MEIIHHQKKSILTQNLKKAYMRANVIPNRMTHQNMWLRGGHDILVKTQ